MKIALVATGGLDRSGRDRVVPSLLWLVERLAARHEVHAFVFDQYPEACSYPLLGAQVHNLGRSRLPGPRLPGLLWRLLRALRRQGPFDVLHAYMGVPPGVLTALGGALLRRPVVVTFAGNELVRVPEIGYGLQRSLRGRLLVRAAHRLAARVTVGSEYMRGLAGAAGLSAEVIPLGVDAALFAPAPEPPGPPWRLLHVASLNPVKDQETLLLALKSLLTREPNVHLDVLGVDTLGGAVERRCRALGLEAFVTFHGLLAVDALPAFYRQAHLLVQSSRHDASPVAVLEAAAVGRASVGTAVGYVADGAPARTLATPVGDPEALARAILLLLHDPARRRAMARAAQDWARVHDADWTVGRIESLYEEVRA
jgi:glycosyltransferase involved in cell wall biosynthesis